jgi:hypothetical protein
VTDSISVAVRVPERLASSLKLMLPPPCTLMARTSDARGVVVPVAVPDVAWTASRPPATTGAGRPRKSTRCRGRRLAATPSPGACGSPGVRRAAVLRKAGGAGLVPASCAEPRTACARGRKSRPSAPRMKNSWGSLVPVSLEPRRLTRRRSAVRVGARGAIRARSWSDLRSQTSPRPDVGSPPRGGGERDAARYLVIPEASTRHARGRWRKARADDVRDAACHAEVVLQALSQGHIILKCEGDSSLI